MAEKVKKGRIWAFIVYPESAAVDWMDELAKTGLPFAVSPLHDADLNADENEKKDHWHVLVCYPGPTTFNHVSTVSRSIGATIPQLVHSVKGYYRYLTHKDNPEKTQYLEVDIRHFNGFRPPDFTEMTAMEKFEIKNRIVDIIEQDKIFEYDILFSYLRKQPELRLEAYFVSVNTMFFVPFLNSRRNRFKELAKGERPLYNHEKPFEDKEGEASK